RHARWAWRKARAFRVPQARRVPNNHDTAAVVPCSRPIPGRLRGQGWGTMEDRNMGQTPPRVALVVEEDAELRSMASALLAESALDVITCESAEAALSVMQRRSDDVALVFA